MAKKKSGDLNINISAEAIRGTEVMRSGEYKYARVSAKIGEDEYISVSYEWKGEEVPDFVMALMAFIQANEEDFELDDQVYASLKERLKG